jgi:hypothetical protein
MPRYATGERRPAPAAGEVTGRAGRGLRRQTRGVTEPRTDDDDQPNNLHPGQHDEGGHGGMATREHDAREEGEEPQED